jgi:hypothetical protein
MSFGTSEGAIFVLILEEKGKVLRRKEIIGLKSNGVGGIVRNYASW